jgi:hypothetical protein
MPASFAGESKKIRLAVPSAVAFEKDTDFLGRPVCGPPAWMGSSPVNLRSRIMRLRLKVFCYYYTRQSQQLSL